MRKVAAIFTLLFSFALFANVSQLAKIDIDSSPSGAIVFVDGTLKGATPLTLTDIKPDRKHHLRLEADDYQAHDSVFTPVQGLNDSMYVELLPMKGILLVTSEPEGAGIFLNGYSLGETPRLITSLDVKSVHNLVLKKVGYLDSKVEVKFSGRKPLHHKAKMVLNSGVAHVKSEPDGAEVILNGISRGVTPVTVSDIPNGRLSLVLKKRGFKTVSREISINAGDTQNLYIKMDALPGTLYLTSVPAGARFYIDGSPRGVGPLRIADLEPEKNYTVRAELDGYSPLERGVFVGNGQTVNEEFRLESNLGKLEIVTWPHGATIEVDGKKVGTTKPGAVEGEWSSALIIPNLKAGEHTVRISAYSHAEVVKHPVLEPSRTVPLKVRLRHVFTPNFRVRTATDTIDGILKSQNPRFITIETKPGVERTIQRENIRSYEYIDRRP